MTIQEALHFASSELIQTSDAPLLDGQRLLLHVLQQSETSFLFAHTHQVLTEAQIKELTSLIQTRKTGKPLAYILGTWEFFGRGFFVDEHVLIPRPETEELVRQAVKASEEISTLVGRKIMVADIGTGSGCIAITLLLESPHITHIYATDISANAITVAKKNADVHKVSDRITFLAGHMLEPIKDIAIDLIVSNPPYVPSSELLQLSTVQTKGLAFEPQGALDGGIDGLDFVNQLKKTNIPLIIETLQGDIEKYGI